jgi:hypothetical protein
MADAEFSNEMAMVERARAGRDREVELSERSSAHIPNACAMSKPSSTQ